MSLIRKHGAVLQAWACLDLVLSWSVFVLLENTSAQCRHIVRPSASYTLHCITLTLTMTFHVLSEYWLTRYSCPGKRSH